MKATGIIRRIDDLGRIVIPKEIRKNLRIKEGENLEIFVQNEEIILRKYSMMNKISDLALELTDAIYTFMKHSIFITDTDQIVAGSGPLKKRKRRSTRCSPSWASVRTSRPVPCPAASSRCWLSAAL